MRLRRVCEWQKFRKKKWTKKIYYSVSWLCVCVRAIYHGPPLLGVVSLNLNFLGGENSRIFRSTFCDIQDVHFWHNLSRYYQQTKNGIRNFFSLWGHVVYSFLSAACVCVCVCVWNLILLWKKRTPYCVDQNGRYVQYRCTTTRRSSWCMTSGYVNSFSPNFVISNPNYSVERLLDF